MKKTKIVTSIGPASNNFDTFKKMVIAGANIARINFSHATITETEKTVKIINEVRKSLNKDVAILYDTKGPEFRIGEVVESGISLISGRTIRIVKNNIIGSQEAFSVNHPAALNSIKIGNTILIENGLMKMQVIDKDLEGLTCKIINGGILYSKKSLSVPGVKLNMPFISQTDYDDIVYACHHDGNFLALSFVSEASDVLEVRKILEKEGRKDIKIISKIENKTGLDNLESIAEVSDGIMIARGDLGVEVSMYELPIYQKKIASTCRNHNIICIVATEMLESMKYNPRPTRAEVTDIANAIYNGTDAVMLSGETTIGKYPIETVMCMNKICEHIEKSITYKNVFATMAVDTPTDAIVKGIVEASNSINAKLIVVPTFSGLSAKLISNLEPEAPILALVTNKEVAYGLQANYGIYTKVVDYYDTMDEMFSKAIEEAKNFMNLSSGDNIIITGGFKSNDPNSDSSVPTNLMKIETI